MTTTISPPPVDVAHSDLAERVQRGARLLDFFHPEWRRLVDPQLLDLADPACCPIGQTYPDTTFSAVMLELAITVGQPVMSFPYQYGFDVEREAEFSLEWIAAASLPERDAWLARVEAAYEQLRGAWLVELGAQA